jgi:hypothetical protein
MALKKWVRFTLFLSAYSPLFALLVLRILLDNYKVITEWNLFSVGISLIFIVVLFSNFILYYLLRKSKKDDNYKHITIKHKENLNHVYLEYLVTYIIPFLNINYSNIKDIFLLFLLLMVVCFMYLKSNLIYVNPMINLFGYNLFKIDDPFQNEYMLLTKQNKLLLDVSIKAVSIHENIIMECDEDE